MSLADVCPDERETLRVGAYLIDRLIGEMLRYDSTLSWKNEFSVHTMSQIADDWLPHARTILGLDESPFEERQG